MSNHKEPTSKELNDLYNVVQQKGVFETQDEFMNFIDTEGVGQLYSFIPEGTFGNAQEFVSYYEPFLKKKDETSQSGSASGVQSTVSTSIGVGDQEQENVSSGLPTVSSIDPSGSEADWWNLYMGTIPGGYALSINEYADFIDGMDDESKEAIGFTGLSRRATANSILQASKDVSSYTDNSELRQQLLSDANITENDINIFRQSSYELMQEDQQTVRMNKKDRLGNLYDNYGFRIFDASTNTQIPYNPAQKQQIEFEVLESIPGELGQFLRSDDADKMGFPKWAVQQLESVYGHNIDQNLSVADMFLQNKIQKQPTVDELAVFEQIMENAKPGIIEAGVEAGMAQRQVAVSSIDLFLAGGDATPDLIKRYVEVTNNMMDLPTSQNMENFNNIYDNAGGGTWGFLSAIYDEPGVAIETIISSNVALTNSYSLGTIAAIETGAFVTGAAAGSPTGAGAVATGGAAMVGSLPYAMAAGGAILETGMSFNEFMNEEIEAKGLTFNEFGVRAVLEDPIALNNIRWRASQRGLVIGSIDALISKLGIRLSGLLPAPIRKPGTLGITSILNIAGGGVSEAGARLVVGQPLDAREIGLEAVGGFQGTTIDAFVALRNRRSFTVTGQSGVEVKMPAYTVYDKIRKAKSSQELESYGIKITEDPAMQAHYDKALAQLKILEQLPTSLQSDNIEQMKSVDEREAAYKDQARVVELELERASLLESKKNNDTATVNDRLKKVNQEIQDILNKEYTIEEAMVEQAGGAPVIPVETKGPVVTETEGGTTIVTEDATLSIEDRPTTDPGVDIETGQEFLGGEYFSPSWRSTLFGRGRTVREKQKEFGAVEDALREEGVYLGGTEFSRGKVTGYLDFWRRLGFSSRRFLPKSIRKFKDQSDAGIKSELKAVQVNERQYERLAKKYVKGGGNLDDFRGAFSLLLSGKDLPPNLQQIVSPEIKALATDMRGHVDLMTQMMIDNGYVSTQIGPNGEPSQAENMMKNMGTYLSRDYKIFYDKNWYRNVSGESRNRAINYFKNSLRGTEMHKQAIEKAEKQGLNSDAEQVLDRMAGQEVNDILNQYGVKDNFYLGKRMGKRDLSILVQRKDIPPEIRALMGEFDEPLQRYASTIQKQAGYLYSSRFLADASKAGSGTFFFQESDIRPEGFNVKIVAEGNKALEGLDGLYTTQEIANELAGTYDDLLAGTKVEGIYNFYQRALSAVKWNKTVGNYNVHLRNITGNIAFMASNGHFNLEKLPDALAVMANDLKGMTNTELNAKMQKYISLGLISPDATLGEIRDLARGDFSNYLEGIASKEDSGFFQKGFGIGKKGVQKLNEFYQGTDNFFKIFAYENEVARYSQAIHGMDYMQLNPAQQAEIDAQVTEIVLNTYPTYTRVPGIVRAIGKFPLVGTFVAFQAESYRNAANIAFQARKELASDNPNIRKIGAKRLVGTVTYAGTKFGVQSSLGMYGGTGVLGLLMPKQYGGLSDEELDARERVDRYSPFWTHNHQVMIESLDRENGTFEVRDISAADGFGNIHSIFNSIAYAENPKEAFKEGLLQTIGPFTSKDILFKFTQDFDKQWNPADTDINNIDRVMAYAYEMAIPAGIEQFRKNISTGQWGIKDDPYGALTGTTTYKIDMRDQVSKYVLPRVGRKFSDAYGLRFDQAEDFLSGKFGLRDELTGSEKFENYKKAVKPFIEELHVIYNDLKFFGIPESEAQQMIMDGALGRIPAARRSAFMYMITNNNIDMSIINAKTYREAN